MLPLGQQIAFLLFAVVTGGIALRGFHRLYLRIRAGRQDPDPRIDRLPARIWYALATTLTQSRTFRKRPAIGFFHACIFYGFVFYLLVNAVDALEGFFPFSIPSSGFAGIAYNFAADIFSALVLIGVIALAMRRFLLPSRRDFRFNERTLLHEDVRHARISRDSLIVSAFILVHVGSRAIGAGAKLAAEGPDRFQPFATLLSHFVTPQHAELWRIVGYWGALGSILAFLSYFPFSKHIHIFMAPAKYLVSRAAPSGVLPALELNFESEDQKLGAARLEDLGWPRLLDAYACIQCNRCQDVCPASVTGKSLSPAALEINKRMELNHLAGPASGFENGAQSPRPLLAFALTPEAAWACTTCGACMQVCPVQNEQMLDIVDIRRNQIMIEGEFPTQLQTAFRGMERAANPWGIPQAQRMAWAEGLHVPTIDENPDADVLYWVGCAASYDPHSQKTARALVQLLARAGVNFAVLGKKECCTGDTARRAGNEYLYRQLAEKNIATLSAVSPKLILATCPHCMNAIGNEYAQLGGHFKVMHHTQFLDSLVASGKLEVEAMPSSIAYHDPCYLGRHNGVYDAPRNLLRVLTNDFVELDRRRENSFCCGAGGAQFWKEEEQGSERISDNRFREAQERLTSGDGRSETKVLAVGCPFCKSMMESTPCKSEGAPIATRDIAELLLESVLKKSGQGGQQTPAAASAQPPAEAPRHPLEAPAIAAPAENPPAKVEEPQAAAQPASATPQPEAPAPPAERKKWAPKNSAAKKEPVASEEQIVAPAASVEALPQEEPRNGTQPAPAQPQSEPSAPPPERKKWSPKTSAVKKEPEAPE
ncbi:MAG: heterodisulfide reductase-related iron-sulfur binding cluster [Terracidiphilus sp.]